MVVHYTISSLYLCTEIFSNNRVPLVVRVLGGGVDKRQLDLHNN